MQVAHPDDASVQRFAVGSLVSLAANDAGNRTRIASEGGVQLILHAMSSHLRSRYDPATFAGAKSQFPDGFSLFPFRRGVQKKGCHALVNLMSNCVKNVAAVARLGGCSAAVAAIRAHRDVGVHAQATAALVSLSADRYRLSSIQPSFDKFGA